MREKWGLAEETIVVTVSEKAKAKQCISDEKRARLSRKSIYSSLKL